MLVDWNEFVKQERASKDTIDVKKAYIDMCKGDITAGVQLSQIVYWHLPGKKGNSSKLCYYDSGYYWLVKGHNEWYNETRLTVKQSRRSIDVMRNLNLIVTKTVRFQRVNKLAIRIDKIPFLQSFSRAHTGTSQSSEALEGASSGRQMPLRADSKALEGVSSLHRVHTETTNNIDEPCGCNHKKSLMCTFHYQELAANAKNA